MSTLRSILPAVMAFAAAAVLQGQLLAEGPESFDRLTTIKGKVFTNVTVTAVEPDGLRLRHDAGVSKITFGDLPPSLAREYPHDPKEAAEFAAKEEERNRQAIARAEEERAQAEHDARCRLAGLPPGFYIPEEGPLTIAQVKGQWLLDNVAHMPTFGEPDREAQEQMIQMRKAEILSGARDREAEEISLRHNLDWYLHHGQTAEAEVARKRLADMQAEVAKRAELELLERVAGALSEIAAKSSYRSDIRADLARFRGELESVHGPIFPPQGAAPHGKTGSTPKKQ
jgi:hypothetical protein